MIEYPYLPDGRKILYVPDNNLFMRAAMEAARNLSSDSMQPTGAVIVLENSIVGTGANQSLLKNSKLQKFHRDGFCIRKFFKIKSGTRYWLCPGCSGYDSHAEPRAILDARKTKEDISGADLYLWGHWWCCKPCWDKMIEAGIKNVFLLDGSEKLFNFSTPTHILGRQFK